MLHASASLEPDSWESFILEHGWRANVHDLAHVLGRTTEEIERLRSTTALKRLERPHTFNTLYTLWHGKAPTPEDWPVPRKFNNRNAYQWQAPELALLASLVGQLGVKEIALALTARLRQITGDQNAVRTPLSVQNKITRLGLQASDVLGGITISAAGKQVGSIAVVQHAIREKHLRAIRVGRLWVIPHEAWRQWKSQRVFAPEGYVQLSTLRQALAIRSDKLSEFARMGYIPGAIRTTPFGAGIASSQFGTWYIDQKMAEKLLADRKAGRPMPWHGKPLMDNLRVTYKLWCTRKHPATCATCQDIWGETGEPGTFDDYVKRYPSLAFGAKRHLTRPWSLGVTAAALAKESGISVGIVHLAIANGMLAAQSVQGVLYISRTDATRWRARKHPTGESAKSWVSLQTAANLYLFSVAELRAHIAGGRLICRTGTQGAARSVEYVSRHQCAQLRETLGFTIEEAARRAGITQERFLRLMQGVDWRSAQKIPLSTVQAVIKRVKSRAGHTIEEAAQALGTSEAWVRARIHDGTVKVNQAQWDGRRSYLTDPMLARLRKRKALSQPDRNPSLGDDWLRLSAAAVEAGVSPATIIRWADTGALARKQSSVGWRYHRNAVRAQATRYWQNVRFKRATPPAWLCSDP